MERVRTVHWEHPTAHLPEARQLAGIDWLRAIADGSFPAPPIAQLLGFTLATIEPGRVVFALESGEHLYNPIGLVHGGVASTLLDSAMGCAVHTTLAAGVGYTTLDLQVRFVRPITAETPPLRCVGEVVHGGATVATTQGRLEDEAGRLYAHGTGSCLVLRQRGAR